MIDSLTNKPIEYVSISVIDSEKNIHTGGVTNSEGKFEISQITPGKYNLKIEKKKGRALINDNILAGSTINMLDTFKNLIKINFSLQQAVAMTSYHAAQYLKENDKGKIEQGFCSNLLVLNQQYNIKEVYQFGDLFPSI